MINLSRVETGIAGGANVVTFGLLSRQDCRDGVRVQVSELSAARGADAAQCLNKHLMSFRRPLVWVGSLKAFWRRYWLHNLGARLPAQSLGPSMAGILVVLAALSTALRRALARCADPVGKGWTLTSPIGGSEQAQGPRLARELSRVQFPAVSSQCSP